MERQAHVVAVIRCGGDRGHGAWGRQQLTLDAAFTDTARNQARILRAAVEHANRVAVSWLVLSITSALVRPSAVTPTSAGSSTQRP